MNNTALIAPVIMFSVILLITLVLRRNAGKKGNDPKRAAAHDGPHQANKVPPAL